MVETLSYDKINLAALNFICGNDSHICMLCFGSIESNEVSLEDTVTVETTYGTENVPLKTIFSELSVLPESSLPQTLCENCAMSAVSSYLFYKLYKFSVEKWNNIIRLINENLDKVNIEAHQSKSIYVVTNKFENIVFHSKTQCSEKDKKMALIKFNGIVKRYKSYKKKETTLDVSCSICEKVFSNLNLLHKHIKRHKKSSNPCTHCPKVFSSSFLLKEHNERMHNPKVLKCDQCSEKLSTERQIKEHVRNYHTEVACKICHVKFKCRKQLRPHLSKHRHCLERECHICHKKIKSIHNFRQHIESCQRGKQTQFICDICKKVYSQKGTLRTHITTEHNFGQVMTCQWCDKKFDAVSKLKSHEVKHTKEKNFQCDQCGRKFVTKAALLYHTRLHTGETPYSCDLCPLKFISSSRRMAHKKRMHFGPKEVCPICGMKFVMATLLRKHVQRHSNPQSKLYVGNIKNSS